MNGPSYMLDPPGPFNPPEVLWDFLRRLRDLDQDDEMVKDARLSVGRYLVVGDRGPPRGSLRPVGPLVQHVEKSEFFFECHPFLVGHDRPSMFSRSQFLVDPRFLENRIGGVARVNRRRY